MHATDGISGREERPPEEARVRDRVLTALLAAGGTADLASLHEETDLSLEILEDAALYLDGQELAQSLADRREP